MPYLIRLVIKLRNKLLLADVGYLVRQISAETQLYNANINEILLNTITKYLFFVLVIPIFLIGLARFLNVFAVLGLLQLQMFVASFWSETNIWRFFEAVMEWQDASATP